MIRRRPLPAIVAFVAVAACESTQEPRVWADLRVASLDVWSGGEVTLVSAAFADSLLPAVTLDDSVLAVRRVNDSTVAARVLDGSGPHTLHVDFAGFVPVDTLVTLYGFRGTEVGPFLSGFLQHLAPEPWVLGAGDSGLAEVDVRTNAILRQWPDTVHSSECTWGVGPSVRPEHYVFFGKAPGGGCTHPWVWQYGTSLTRVDSIWALEDMWAVAEIGPGGSIAGADDNVTISHCDSGGCVNQFYQNMGGSLTGVTMGRLAQRAILHSYLGWIVDGVSGDTLRRLSSVASGFAHIEGAAFTPGEDTAYVVGSQGSFPSRLYVVAPVSATVLDTLTLPDVTAFDVARDPVRPWLYVFAVAGTVSSSMVPRLIVLEQGTLAPIAVLRAPASAALSTLYLHQFRLVPDPDMDAVYVVATNQTYDAHQSPSYILRFDLLP